MTQPEEIPDDAYAALVGASVVDAGMALLLLSPDGVVRAATGRDLSLPADELVGRSIWDVEHTDEQARDLTRALTGTPVRNATWWRGRCWQASYTPMFRDGRLTGVVGSYQDVTELAQRELQLAARESHLAAVLEAADEAILVLAPDARVVTVNARGADLFEGRVHPGVSLRDVLGERLSAALDRRLDRLAGGHRDRYEVQLRTLSGEPFWLRVAASPLHDDDGTFAGSVAVLTDITSTKHEELRLHHVARTDPLTGVLNRLTLSDRIEHALSRRDAGVVAAMFCDVDDLKATNDRFGHVAGDELLRRIAARIGAALRPADTLARYGGDEFVVVCEDLPDVAEAVHLAERVRAAVAQPLAELVPGTGLRVPTVSVGVATAPPHSTPNGLLTAADTAAYAAKRAGRNTIELSL